MGRRSQVSPSGTATWLWDTPGRVVTALSASNLPVLGQLPDLAVQVSVTFKDMNTLRIVTPTLSPGPQKLVLISPDGESVTFDAAFFAQ